MKFVVIADDNTGATDAAGMLTYEGVKTCQVNSLEELKNIQQLNAFDALVIGTQSRSVDPQEAYHMTVKAIKAAELLHPSMIQIKYCSTFDSTPKGNIGQFLDAALDVIGQQVVVVCPALPVNGRTTYMGYHFVKDVLLSESPMKDHPLNPMTDANLVRWLSYQTKRKTGLLSIEQIRKGKNEIKKQIEVLKSEGVAHIITDAITQEDIELLMSAISDHKIISGGSGITAEVAPILFPNRKPLSFENRIKNIKKGTLVLSGSLSKVTASQAEHALANGFKGIKIDPIAIISGAFDIKKTLKEATELLSQGDTVIIYSDAETKLMVHQMAQQKGISEAHAGEMISNALSAIGAGLISSNKIGRLVIAGGETSGSICKNMGFEMLEIGLPLDPGVPYCFPMNNPDLLLVLKSGNFGSTDLYTKVKKL